MQSLWMLFATFAFSIMGVCVKLASSTYSVAEIILYRGLIGVVFIYALIHRQGGSLRTPLFWQHLWRCAVGTTALWLWFIAIGLLPLPTAMTLNYMAPIWISAILFLAAWRSGRQRFEWRLTAAIVASFIGVSLLLRPSIHHDQWLGGVLGLCSGALSALAYLQVRRLGQLGEPESRVVFYFSVTGMLAGLAGCLLGTDAHGASIALFRAHTARGMALLLGIGVLAALAQMAMTRAYRLGNTLLTANLQYTGIVFSSLWGILIWSDALGWSGWCGIAIILASGIVATFYNIRSTAAAKNAPPPDPIAAEPDARLARRPNQRKRMPYTTLISAAELAAHIADPDWIILDCRHDLTNPEFGRAAYAEGHLPHAQFAHLDTDLAGDKFDDRGSFRGRHPLPKRDAFIKTLQGWGVSDDTQVVAYDAHGGMFAARLWWMLRWVGHEAVAVLDGGLPAWTAQGLPLSTEVFLHKPGRLSERPSLVSEANAEDLLRNLESRQLAVIDARAPDRFRGENETLDPVGGHIPGAKNRFFKDNLAADGRFKSAEQLRADFSQLIGEPTKAVMQCGSGVTACHNLLALEVAGLKGTALYPGSWSEWCSDPARPVARD